MCQQGTKKGLRGAMGLDQRPGKQSGGWLQSMVTERGKTEDRGDTRETQPRTGRGDRGWEGGWGREKKCMVSSNRDASKARADGVSSSAQR